MSTPNSDPIEFCYECENEYVPSAPESGCPLCPFIAKRSSARAAATEVEPFRVVSAINETTFRRELNRRYAQGWDLVEFKVGHSYAREAGEGDPVFIALVCQAVNREPYRDALEAWDRADRELNQRQEQCLREVEEARAGEDDPASLRFAI